MRRTLTMGHEGRKCVVDGCKWHWTICIKVRVPMASYGPQIIRVCHVHDRLLQVIVKPVLLKPFAIWGSPQAMYATERFL